MANHRRGTVLFWLGLAMLAAFAVHLIAGGSAGLPIGRVLAELAAGDTGRTTPENLIVWRLRLPRACAALFVGAILGAVGSAFQAYFRNPLAEPYVVGVSSGAAVGGALAVFLGLESGLGLLGWSFLGGALSLGLVLTLAGGWKSPNVNGLLVAGVVIGAMLFGVTTLVLGLAGQDSGRILRWLLGSTTPMFWDRVAVLAGFVVVGVPLLWSQARPLNAMALGEFSAQRLGVDPFRTLLLVLGAGTAMTAATVGSVGIVGFVGLVAPHLGRRLAGSDVRWCLPASGLIGGSLLLLSDVLAQRIQPGTELPLGAVTAVIGAPALLLLMRKREATP
ncbi:MAG: iron ABC transporter permease [Fimbriimonadaceae bacterium]|nr:iron ABC transporter permease [Fimbriimonadaceae bacterium]QYK55828.1 MAG: iron ABC transporter permease [Fimbriimonadaceae bacterium]